MFNDQTFAPEGAGQAQNWSLKRQSMANKLVIDEAEVTVVVDTFSKLDRFFLTSDPTGSLRIPNSIADRCVNYIDFHIAKGMMPWSLESYPQ